MEGGRVNLKRKDYWQAATGKKKLRSIRILVSDKIGGHTVSQYPLAATHYMSVDNGLEVKISDWLIENKSLWFDEWKKWSQCVALTSNGDFHWTDNSTTVAFWYQNQPIDFVTWKKQCYIKPAYDLMPQTEVFKFLQECLQIHHVPLGLVHPKAREAEKEDPVTPKHIRTLYDSSEEFVCMPYCVAGLLLNVGIDQ